MEEFKSIGLTAAEKKLIRKIAKLQMEALREIQANNMEIDLVTFCLEHKLNLEQFKLDNKSKLIIFMRIYENPETFITLNDYQAGIIRHILMNHFKGDKYTDTKSSIWRKLSLPEELKFSLQ